MRYVSLVTLILGSLGILWLLLSGPAPGAPPAAHAAVLASVEATSCPAPERVVKLALRQYRAACRAYDEWQRAKHCLGEQGRLRVDRRPGRDATAAVWIQRMERWQRQRRDFDRRLEKLIHEMRNPGGSSSGVRWLPLARWVGWPADTLAHLAYIIQRESSGRPRAFNPVIGCSGLLQVWPGHVSAADRQRLFEPEFNLRVGLRLYRQSGWAPWAL